ncbi:RNA-directed DNA polymerase, eukaryota, reverse transcriptase zinc-binding domain protein [Tanacetum coccineum]
MGREEYSLLLRKLLRGAKLVLCNCMGILWFKSEDGMKKVLESGTWMVQNVPLVLNVWEPRIWLDKTEPSVNPIWVCVYNIPMELCNGNGIGKIMSGVGKPLLMDNMTKERCLKKSGKLDFARVLVEVSADDDLPSLLEIFYPPIGNRPAKVGVLDVKYQWKPPLCTHCKTFGHSTLSCKVRPRTEEEFAANNLKDALKIGKPDVEIRGKKNVNDDGFTVVGKKNMPAALQMNAGQPKTGGQNKWGGRFQGSVRQGYSNMGGGNNGVSGMSGGKYNSSKKAIVQEVKKKLLVEKHVLDDQVMKDKEECVLETMKEEYNSEYGLDPSYEYDDVATEDGDMAKAMRAEDVDLDARSCDIGGDPNVDNVSNRAYRRVRFLYTTLLFSLAARSRRDESRCSSADPLMYHRLDRVMCNDAFVEKFVNSNALFLPFVASDHTPTVVEIPVISRAKPRPFKFANFLANKEEFFPIVKNVWDSHIPGHAIFIVNPKP